MTKSLTITEIKATANWIAQTVEHCEGQLTAGVEQIGRAGAAAGESEYGKDDESDRGVPGLVRRPQAIKSNQTQPACPSGYAQKQRDGSRADLRNKKERRPERTKDGASGGRAVNGAGHPSKSSLPHAKPQSGWRRTGETAASPELNRLEQERTDHRKAA
jgi:hypothetical protein